MDPNDSLQDVTSCSLCESKVQSYCKDCVVKLCEACAKQHVSGDHTITPYTKWILSLKYPKCAEHQDKNCNFYCKDCDNLVCYSCTTKNHMDHKFNEVGEIYRKKLQIINNDTKDLEDILSEFPSSEKIERDCEVEIHDLDEKYEKIENEMSQTEKEWHRDISSIFNTMKKEVNEMKHRHKTFLEKHYKEIKESRDLIQQTTEMLKEIPNSYELCLTIEHNSKINEFRKLPTSVKISLPSFIPNTIVREKLCKFVPLSIDTEENTSKCLQQTHIIDIMETGYAELRCVNFISKERVWTSGRTDEIKCFHNNGELIQTIKTISRVYPNDIAVDSNGDLVYCDGETISIYKVTNAETEEFIRLQGWVPYKLCFSSSGDLLVSMFSENKTQSKVVRYGGTTDIQTIQYDEDGKPLFSGHCKVKYIAENRNLDICVSDMGANTVVAVNQFGKFRWKYTSEQLNRFTPVGITTDSQSHILAADYKNNLIHILDLHGQFLSYINNCNLELPLGLFLDNNDILYVCETERGNVKKIKYFT